MTGLLLIDLINCCCEWITHLGSDRSIQMLATAYGSRPIKLQTKHTQQILRQDFNEGDSRFGMF